MTVNQYVLGNTRRWMPGISICAAFVGIVLRLAFDSAWGYLGAPGFVVLFVVSGYVACYPERDMIARWDHL